MPPRTTPILGFSAAAGVLAGLVAIGAMAGIADSRDPDQRPALEGEVPLPVINRWLAPDTGAFVNPDGPWDNRNLSAQEKAKGPWYDPRWRPFSECMAGEGHDVRVSTSVPFNQSDLDSIIARVNVQRPDGKANKALRRGDAVPGIAGTFLKCANRWLTIGPDDYEKNGIVWLEPGEVPLP